MAAALRGCGSKDVQTLLKSLANIVNTVSALAAQRNAKDGLGLLHQGYLLGSRSQLSMVSATVILSHTELIYPVAVKDLSGCTGRRR